MQEILVVCPQPRDVDAASSGRFRVRLEGPDLDLVDADPATLLGELALLPADGVVGTKDRSALVAALVARRRGLPGPDPAAVVACQHKPTSRAIQRGAAPEATPRFALVGTSPPAFALPWFVKPVVGRLSQEARRVDDPAVLATIAESGRYRDGYARLAREAGLASDAVHGFILEEFVAGDEVTLEGYVHRGRVTAIGVTDSVKYEGTNSFQRFEYPSALPPDRLREVAGLAERLVAAHGLDDCFFNVEFLVPRDGTAMIVEINARIASQFAPLVEAVHGRSTYDVLFALACGEDPGWSAGGGRGVAISYVVRVFEDAVVDAVPDSEPGLEILVRPGRALSEQGMNDTASYRLAIFTEWGETREAALQQCLQRARSLRFELREAGPRR
jgi:ATP-grasp domain